MRTSMMHTVTLLAATLCATAAQAQVARELRVFISADMEGITGVVNELLIQLQSFDAPTRAMRFRGWFIDFLNRFLAPLCDFIFGIVQSR